MSNVISSLFFFILAVSVLIAVHEFGHFWVARRCGVKVLRFSIGFGKPLLKWYRKGDDTEYVIAAVPMGGYVKMLDEREGEVNQNELDLAFNRKPVASRIAIVLAGPLFNFILAILAYWFIFVLGVSGMKPIIGEITENSLAEAGGLQQKETIVRIDGNDTATWHSVMIALLDKSLGRKLVEIEVRDENQQLHIRNLDFGAAQGKLDRNKLLESIGLHPYTPKIPVVIGGLQSDGAAEKSGFKPGDKVISVDGEFIEGWEQWVSYIQARPGIHINVTIDRDGEEMALNLVPDTIKSDDKAIGRIGASVKFPADMLDEFYATEKYPLHKAIVVAISKTWDMSALTLRMLANILIGEVSVTNISGPISIAQYAGQSASIGLVSFLNFMALISISLGVLNLLPIPLLDGGHLMYYLIELVKGSPVSEEAQLLGQRLGIAFLAILMVLAFYNDIERLIG